ncbi:MAG: putative membrane protein [Bradymonadia bacterium]|jgi:uncharacterized membrane protein
MNFLKQFVVFFVVMALGMMFFAQLGGVPFIFIERTLMPPGSPDHETMVRIGMVLRVVFAVIASLGVWMTIRRWNAQSAAVKSETAAA